MTPTKEEFIHNFKLGKIRKERQKEAMLKDYESHICRNGRKQIYRAREQRRNGA